MKPSHRKHDRAWCPAPKAWHYRRSRTFPPGSSCATILKALYPQSRIPRGGEKLMEKPPWALLAFERHWVSADEIHAVPLEWRGRMTVGFEESPFFGLVKRDWRP